MSDSFYQPQRLPDALGTIKPPAKRNEAEAKAAKGTSLAMTDTGNGERFAARNRGCALWCNRLNCWLVFNGVRWIIDEQGQVQQWAKQAVRAIWDEARLVKDSGVQSANKVSEELIRHSNKSEAAARIDAMLKLAKSEPGMSATVDDFDRDPLLFNTETGTLNLQTGELQPHDPADRITKLSPVAYDPAAECPLWLKTLGRIFNADRERVAFVQRAIGYAMTGTISEQVLIVAHGTGANGKSVTFDTISDIAGDYAATVDAGLFTDSKSGMNEQRYELAELRGKRLLIASESEQGRRLKVALIKTLTGDERVKARPIYGKPIEYARTFKPWLVTNHRPTIRDDGEAVWRRVRLLPFEVTIPEHERDPKLRDKLKAEYPGILRWMLDGCMAWQRDELGDCEAVTRATDDYRADSDPMGDFIRERCKLGLNCRTKAGDLRAAYECHCEEQGERPLRGKLYTEALSKHGVEPDRTKSQRAYIGIGLLTDEVTR